MLTWAGEPLNTEADGLMNRRGKLDTIAVNGPEDVAVEWDFVDWRVHEQNVIRLRRRIFKATREQDWATVRSLQKLMLGSWSNTLISVRQVTQRNAGRRTAGIDGEVALSSPEWAELAVRVHRSRASWDPMRFGACTFRRPRRSVDEVVGAQLSWRPTIGARSPRWAASSPSTIRLRCVAWLCTLHAGGESFRAWTELEHGVRTGAAPFQAAHGDSFFQFLRKTAAAGAVTVVLVYVLGLFHVVVPAEVGSAVTFLFTSVTGCLVKEGSPAAARIQSASKS